LLNVEIREWKLCVAPSGSEWNVEVDHA